jgi:CheY-like chemotaxis protein
MPKILILDDSEVLLAVARASLEAAGYTVATRESPIGFSAMLRDEQPDLALIDVLMPALAGPRLVEILRPLRATRFGRTLLVLHSGILESELSRMTQECGADGYIVKSRMPRDLSTKVGHFLVSHGRSGPATRRE